MNVRPASQNMYSNNNLKNNRNEPSFKANYVATETAKEALKIKLEHLYSRSPDDIRKEYFGENPFQFSYYFLDFKRRFKSFTKEISGIVKIEKRQKREIPDDLPYLIYIDTNNKLYSSPRNPVIVDPKDFLYRPEEDKGIPHSYAVKSMIGKLAVLIANHNGGNYNKDNPFCLLYRNLFDF